MKVPFQIRGNPEAQSELESLWKRRAGTDAPMPLVEDRLAKAQRLLTPEGLIFRLLHQQFEGHSPLLLPQAVGLARRVVRRAKRSLRLGAR